MNRIRDIIKHQYKYTVFVYDLYPLNITTTKPMKMTYTHTQTKQIQNDPTNIETLLSL